MRHSVVGQAPSTDERWPTACPACGKATLAYLYEGRGGDIYHCDACGNSSSVRDERQPDGSWRRRIRQLTNF